METDKTDEQKTEEAGEAPPPMNRAERRALEHRKKSGAASGSPNGLRGHGSGGGSMHGSSHTNTHLPRTGHK